MKFSARRVVRPPPLVSASAISCSISWTGYSSVLPEQVHDRSPTKAAPFRTSNKTVAHSYLLHGHRSHMPQLRFSLRADRKQAHLPRVRQVRMRDLRRRIRIFDRFSGSRLSADQARRREITALRMNQRGQESAVDIVTARIYSGRIQAASNSRGAER
jgi:hypothetical protein